MGRSRRCGRFVSVPKSVCDLFRSGGTSSDAVRFRFDANASVRRRSSRLGCLRTSSVCRKGFAPCGFRAVRASAFDGEEPIVLRVCSADCLPLPSSSRFLLPKGACGSVAKRKPRKCRAGKLERTASQVPSLLLDACPPPCCPDAALHYCIRIACGRPAAVSRSLRAGRRSRRTCRSTVRS